MKDTVFGGIWVVWLSIILFVVMGWATSSLLFASMGFVPISIYTALFVIEIFIKKPKAKSHHPIAPFDIVADAHMAVVKSGIEKEKEKEIKNRYDRFEMMDL